MGYRIAIVFDLKSDSIVFKSKLRGLVKKKFDSFKTGIRESEGLQIRLEEGDY